jgi:hypothetical protein
MTGSESRSVTAIINEAEAADARWRAANKVQSIRLTRFVEFLTETDQLDAFVAWDQEKHP